VAARGKQESARQVLLFFTGVRLLFLGAAVPCDFGGRARCCSVYGPYDATRGASLVANRPYDVARGASPVTNGPYDATRDASFVDRASRASAGSLLRSWRRAFNIAAAAWKPVATWAYSPVTGPHHPGLHLWRCLEAVCYGALEAAAHHGPVSGSRAPGAAGIWRHGMHRIGIC